jgi:hypothetical protein
MTCRSAANIKIEPMELSYAQKPHSCVQALANVADSLDGTHWLLNATPSSGILYYVWYDGAVAADPAPAGRTAITVVVTPDLTAAQVAALTATAIDAVPDFGSRVTKGDATKLVVKGSTYEPWTDPTDVDSGFTFELEHVGFEHFWGFTQGDLELAMDQQLLDISATQRGTEIITQIIQGMNSTLSVAFEEVTDSNLDRLVRDTTGGSCTVSATELIGYGFGQTGDNVLSRSARLILHPVRLASSDRSQDWTLMLAYPKMDSIVFSGESPQIINATFNAFEDEFVDESCNDVNKVVFGDALLL